ncbi:MAG TPA: hypothetical protein PL078_04380 [Bacillota bacterium]|jgi:hypothetical protein|nr:hypothetical protein [Peptococcaceae bacterium MAG4]NLW37711.1 hypothetical protein [Peptococcaceae bacterium]HPU35513.1 hypothetical protein [Bacillota bacterium]HPZ43224.1 hypothetical protein [Bacillota bacterium]HQD76030.1 hypothetical protein [Bacillota bacterium]
MRVFNAAAAGLITALLLYLLVSLGNTKVVFYFFLVGWVIFTLIFNHRAESIRKIWARACLTAAVECLIIPVAAQVLPFFYGQQSVQAARQGAFAAGQSVGSAIGGGLVNMLTGYAGVLIGFVLLATAYLSLKPVRRRR